ncbi:MAG: tRNA (N(6)-L-threonylcarbamoyladenosine(37)-C(2))-methylthiotransferase MtaB [Ignavibacteriae bacterium]|nr:tRNA (N(6)-L-threonylcarbamoyladenosine(37)-C(2))-methylthiotransferase MtaB [Ignavibacteriota bacterium]MCB9217012.1 tRNA (N(6)-L-threonylcarbamoyladenosine(37)-C(2))-methylthiotransferase MtaB [Ignavibacteria bacterium]
MKRVALHTLGCKLNYAETSAIGERFKANGFDLIDFGEDSDVVLINSCTVTENANKECRQLVRRALRKNPSACVIVTGCYAQLKPEEIASIEGVDYVLGSAEKFRLFDLVDQFAKREVPRVSVGEIAHETGFGPAYSSEADARTRAFLKVQDGCDYNCSFCTIPLARGSSRSQPLDDVVAQAKELVGRGYLEIVLTGVNTGDYGKKDGTDLYELLCRLHEVEGLRRLRISSIEPNLLTDQIIELAASSDRMMPHFHVPLQSGSDKILGKMRRRYRSSDYRDRVEKILHEMPDAGIGVDVIVGFPGEGEDEFQQTYQFLHALPVSYFHVFTYSERENTPANEFEGSVPVAERRERTRMLRTLSEKKRGSFARKFEGSIRPVLFEAERGDGTVQGYSDNYVRVALTPEQRVAEQIVEVQIGEWSGDFAEGEVVEATQLTDVSE